MEITLEAIISLAGLLLGGGGGAFFTWRWMNRRAKAEAVTAEVEAAKEMQSLYKQMLNDANEYLEDARNKVDGLRQERDHYKQDRDELREKIAALTKMFYELKTDSEKERSELRVEISKLKGQMNGILPLTCTVPDCKLRQVFVFDELERKGNVAMKSQQTKRDIEPVDKGFL